MVLGFTINKTQPLPRGKQAYYLAFSESAFCSGRFSAKKPGKYNLPGYKANAD
jgi:hypothetical protein